LWAEAAALCAHLDILLPAQRATGQALRMLSMLLMECWMAAILAAQLLRLPEAL